MADFRGPLKGWLVVKYPYSCYGYTRGGGKVWHGGIDIGTRVQDDQTLYMPYYNGEKEIRGTVMQARQVLSHLNRTWEWGQYVCVKFDNNQTPDPVNYLYFCHCSKLLVKKGDRVKSGDALAILGNTGNAAGGWKHVHLEARKKATSGPVCPTAYSGTKNAAGIY